MANQSQDTSKKICSTGIHSVEMVCDDSSMTTEEVNLLSKIADLTTRAQSRYVEIYSCSIENFDENS